jgi:hypothetical protein
MPVLQEKSDELAEGDVEGAGDSAENLELGRGGAAENSADDGGGDFEASGQVALGEAALFHELIDSMGDAFLELPVNSKATEVPAFTSASFRRIGFGQHRL